MAVGANVGVPVGAQWSFTHDWHLVASAFINSVQHVLLALLHMPLQVPGAQSAVVVGLVGALVGVFVGAFVGLGVSHTPPEPDKIQIPLEQSLASKHPIPGAHAGHTSPPQPTSVSEPSLPLLSHAAVLFATKTKITTKRYSGRRIEVRDTHDGP